MTKDIIDREDTVLTARAREAYRYAIRLLSDCSKDHHVEIRHADLKALTDRLEWLQGTLDGVTKPTTTWNYEATEHRVKFSPVGRPGQCILSREGTVEIVNQSIIPKQTRQGA